MMQQGMSPAQAGSAAAKGAADAAFAPAAPAALLSPADVAKQLGVPEADVMAIIEAGELKAKKIGASFRITKAALDTYLAQ